jgi:uncharacterized membrane protein
MTKNEFFLQLEKNLSDIPVEESNKVMDYYNEYFAEATESGKSEEEILNSIETPDKIAARVKAEAVFILAEEKPTISNWIKVMIAVLGIFALPIAFPIAISVFAVIFAMSIAVIGIILFLSVAAIGLVIAGILIFAAGTGLLFAGGGVVAIGKAGIGLILLGLAIFMAITVVVTARGMILITTQVYKCIYNRITKKAGKK